MKDVFGHYCCYCDRKTQNTLGLQESVGGYYVALICLSCNSFERLTTTIPILRDAERELKVLQMEMSGKA